MGAKAPPQAWNLIAMSSILTNNSAMTALQTLKGINSNLSKTQDEISTGKSISSAKDNSAVWAISKVMEADVSGFKAVSDSLSVGKSTAAVASVGAEQIVVKLREMRDLAISAHNEGAPHAKIEATLAEKRLSIQSTINGSQFNGVNLLKTDVDGNGGTGLTVVASMDRIGAGTPTLQTITVASADFETNVDTTTATAITDSTTAATALAEIEGWLTAAIDGAATLGAQTERMSDQGEFISKLSDVMKSGIGSLVDADMEEASARLQALQVQQQLGVQALSIANQAPQSLMSLFR
jgi:flagellin